MMLIGHLIAAQRPACKLSKGQVHSLLGCLIFPGIRYPSHILCAECAFAKMESDIRAWFPHDNFINLQSVLEQPQHFLCIIGCIGM